MMTTHDRFGGLRALLQETPSEAAWEALCAELARWDDGERERVALPYVLDHLDRWPEAIKREVRGEAPGWLWGLGNALHWPKLEVVERLAASEGAWRVRRIALAATERHAALVGLFVGLRAYTIELYAEEPAALAALMEARWPASLRALKLSAVHGELRGDDAWLADKLAQNETLGGLEELVLEELKVGEAGARALAASPHLRGLRTLDVSYNGIGEAGARALAESTHMAGLKRLDLSGEALGEGLAALLASQHMGALEVVVLRGATLGAEDVAALRGVAGPPALNELVLDDVHLSAPAMEALAEAPVLRALRTLRVEARAEPRAAARLLASPHLTGLRRLTLRSPGASEPLVMAVAQSEALGGLESLILERCVLSERVCEALGQSAAAARLRTLAMWGCEGDGVGLLEGGAWGALWHVQLAEAGEALGDAGAIRLAACEALGGVERLNLSGGQIGDVGAQALARSPQLRALRVLSLGNNQIGDVGAAALVERAGLEELWLGKNRIGDAGAQALASSPLMGETLGMLAKNQIGDAGMLALIRSPHLRADSRIDLSDNPLSDAGILALAAEPALARLEGKLVFEVPGVSDAAWVALLDSPHTRAALRDAVKLWRYKERRR